jgi:hypothetical protein
MKSFNITYGGTEYTIDVVIHDDDDVEVFVERYEDSEEEIPDDELLAVVQYLAKEGFIPSPDPE